MSVRDTIISKYGEPDAVYQSKHCEVWKIKQDFPWFPAEKIFINKDFKAKLHTAFSNLERAGVHTEIKTFDGCFAMRSVRGKKAASLHSWAMAVDLNAATEKMLQKKTNWSGQFIAIMKAAGLFWGGDWRSRIDSMHFALYNG